MAQPKKISSPVEIGTVLVVGSAGPINIGKPGLGPLANTTNVQGSLFLPTLTPSLPLQLDSTNMVISSPIVLDTTQVTSGPAAPGLVLTSSGPGFPPMWLALGGGGGTVTSVGLALPASVFSISGSPVVGSGVLTGSFVTQAANTVFAGPSLGVPAIPTFRGLVAADIPPINLTTGVTGVLPIANGGTNTSVIGPAGSSVYSTGTAYGFSPVGVLGQILTSGGAGSPTWTSLSSIGVTTFSAGTTGFTPIIATSGAITLAGTLGIANGGTNSTTALNNNRIMVSSGGAIVEAAALTDGQLLIGSTGAAPVAANITAGAGITVTNGPGTITISSPSANILSLAAAKSGTQAVAALATPTTVTGWSTAAPNYADLVGFVPASGVFTAPATGRYQFLVNLSYLNSASASGDRSVQLFLNGATVVALQTVQPTPDLTLSNVLSISRDLALTAADTVVVQVINNAGIANTMTVSASPSTYLSILRLA